MLNEKVWNVTARELRSKAKKLNLPFDLTGKYLSSIAPTNCPVLGIPLQRCANKQSKATSPSVDRLIPEKGYVQGNIIIVSGLANAVRSNASPEQIIAVGEFYRDKLKGKGKTTE